MSQTKKDKQKEKNKQARYQALEELKYIPTDEVDVTCISCDDIFYPIKGTDLEVRCPSCGHQNIIK